MFGIFLQQCCFLSIPLRIQISFCLEAYSCPPSGSALRHLQTTQIAEQTNSSRTGLGMGTWSPTWTFTCSVKHGELAFACPGTHWYWNKDYSTWWVLVKVLVFKQYNWYLSTSWPSSHDAFVIMKASKKFIKQRIYDRVWLTVIFLSGTLISIL